MRQTLQRLGHSWWRLVSLPPTMLHELTHFLLSLPWAEGSAIICDDEGVVHGVNWTDDAPRWGIVLASLGPTFLGALVGIIGLWRLATVPPGGSREWLIAGTLAAYWSIYVAPSDDDLDIHNPGED